MAFTPALCLNCQIPLEQKGEAVCPGCAAQFAALKQAADEAKTRYMAATPAERALLIAPLALAEKEAEDFHQKILNEYRRRTIVHINSQPHPRTVWRGK